MFKKKMHYFTMLNLVAIGNVLCAVIIIGTIFGAVYYKYMKESVYKSLENNVGQIESYASSYMENMRGVAEKLAMDVELGNAVEDNRMGEIYQEEWYQDIQSDRKAWVFAENVCYTNTYEQIPYYLFATKFKNKFYQKRDEEDRIIIVTFNIAEIEKYIDDIADISGINVNIFEKIPDGSQMIYQARQDADIEGYLLNNLGDTKDRSRVESQYLFFQKESLVVDWKIVGNIRQSAFYKLAYRVEPWMVLVVTAVLFLSVIISNISSRAVSGPLKKLEVFRDDGRKRITQFHTPYGTLREEWEFIHSTYSWAPREMLLKSAGDIRAMKYVYEHTRYYADYELAISRSRSIGENGLVLVYAPKTPLMELVALRAGIETVVELYMDEREELGELLEIMQNSHEEALHLTLACPADCIMVPDNLSSELVGGALYDTYMQPLHEKWTDMIRETGKQSFVHLDGTLNPLLTKLSKAGFDVIEAVTPAPVGDIPLEKLRELTQEGTVIWGGIPGGYFTAQLSDEEFDRYVIQTITYMKKHPGFVLGVADQVVPGASPDRIAQVNQLIERYGRYGG